jgi:hypothetical protein
MFDSTAWREAKLEILRRLDIDAECSSFGLVFTGAREPQNGWRACRAFGRADRTPSAGVYVEHGKLRGMYKDFVSEDRALGFFDLAVRIGGFANFKSAFYHYAEKTCVELPKRSKTKKTSVLHRIVPAVAQVVEAEATVNAVAGESSQQNLNTSTANSQTEADKLRSDPELRQYSFGDFDNNFSTFLSLTRSERIRAGSDKWLRNISANFGISRHAMYCSLGIGLYPSAEKIRVPTNRVRDPRIDDAVDYCAFPVRNSNSHVVGSHLAPIAGGDTVTIGQHGLVCSEYFDHYPGMIVITRSLREAAIFLSFKICAIAVTHPESCVEELVARLRKCTNDEKVTYGPPVFSTLRPVVVMHDNDDLNWNIAISRHLSNAGIEMSFWVDPPSEYASCLDWLLTETSRLAATDYAQLFEREDVREFDTRLVDVGEYLAGWLDINCHMPDEIRKARRDKPTAKGIVLPFGEAVVEILDPGDPSYLYLSPAAKARGTLEYSEIEAATNALIGYHDNKPADVEYWMQEGIRRSELVDAVYSSFCDGLEIAERGCAKESPTKEPRNNNLVNFLVSVAQWYSSILRETRKALVGGSLVLRR